jgi:hypothetical protein
VRVAFVALAALLGRIPAQADDAVPLAHDPFVRPRLVELVPPAESMRVPLELRAVLSAGDDSLANVGGQIVHVGEEVSGYRLVAVSEDGALFEQDGRSLRVPLRDLAPPAAAEAPLQAQEADDDAG